jgi:hypothetical protein
VSNLAKLAPWGARPIRRGDTPTYSLTGRECPYTHVITDRNDRALFLCYNEETAVSGAERRNIDAATEVLS